MKHAVYQMDIVAGDPKKNRENVRQWIKQTAEAAQPDVIVLPEMWTTGYTLSELKELADVDAEPTTSFLSDMAITYHVNIIGGSFANYKGEGIYNTSIVVDRQGVVVNEYDKIHLVPMLDEPRYLTGGQEKVTTFELDGVKMGLIICYDLRFPELARSLALQDAQIMYVVAEWPAVRIEHWKTLQVARAIENQMYVVSSNRIGSYNGVDFGGSSMIIDPTGNPLRTGSETKEETIVESLALDTVSEIRKAVPIFSNRVPHLY
ncbi:putative amidohydrolase [Virgibacillus natechei]|uniref:Amidohydrolase n=1 Tax=Virgibacillus natechei TaxID=1216297 RepID=A0ABS4IH57_9BACI|nr:carbon-nitrogen family hydrolase [Virgibacillus natechei]MBP1970272.1 putative amidohydrolase [Virgibacillus natechei]UZD12784.1 carbon-nitrogen family hydrolase [Virgibacillus natechei]